jgi:hypothetical protein
MVYEVYAMRDYAAFYRFNLQSAAARSVEKTLERIEFDAEDPDVQKNWERAMSCIRKMQQVLHLPRRT